MHKDESIMDVKLLIKIHILAMPISSVLPIKATSDTNIDMVKPILDIRETINTQVQFSSLGFFDNPIKLLIYVNNIIPNGFPIKSPRYIPKYCGIFSQIQIRINTYSCIRKSKQWNNNKAIKNFKIFYYIVRR